MAGFHSGEIIEKRLMYNDYFLTPEGQHLAMRAVSKFMHLEQDSESEEVLDQDTPAGIDAMQEALSKLHSA